MQLLHIFSLLLLTLVAYTSAQRCPGGPPHPFCTGIRNVGHRGRRCLARTMWYYNPSTRQCRQMRYLGCGGNNNRWCSRAACQQNCRRR